MTEKQQHNAMKSNSSKNVMFYNDHLLIIFRLSAVQRPLTIQLVNVYCFKLTCSQLMKT